MISVLSGRIADAIIKNGIRKSSERDVIKYGTEVFITLVFNTVFLFSAAFLLDKMNYLAAMILFFPVLRQSLGGYHFESSLGCMAATNITFLLIIFLGETIMMQRLIISTIVCLASVMIVIMYSPAENENKPLSRAEKTRYRKISIIVVLIMTIIVIWGQLYFMSYEKLFF